MKKLILIFLALTLALSILACTQTTNPPAGSDNPGETDANGDPVGTPGTSNPTSIVLTFNGTKLETSVQDTGITVDGSAFVITRGGSYELRGDLSGGQIRVAVGKDAEVELILNNFTASNNTSAPLYIESTNEVTIFLAAGSVNTLTDATLYQYANPAEDKPNACLYSSDDMKIEGTGTLNINGNYNNGIGCKNDLRIKDCTLNITAPNNMLKGNDSVEIENATVKLSGGEDAIKSDTADRTDKGYILIASGSKVEINCIDDALQAAMSITVEAGCTVTGTCGGDALNCPGTINASETAMQITSSAQPEA